MKTHEFAKGLAVLARVLRARPNVDLDEVSIGLPPTPQAAVEAALSLTTLLDLSRFEKQQWIDLIEQHKLPIPVSRKDSARNVIGKIVAYLEDHPETLEEVKRSTRGRASAASPELLKAFSILLEGRQ